MLHSKQYIFLCNFTVSFKLQLSADLSQRSLRCYTMSGASTNHSRHKTNTQYNAKSGMSCQSPNLGLPPTFRPRQRLLQLQLFLQARPSRHQRLRHITSTDASTTSTIATTTTDPDMARERPCACTMSKLWLNVIIAMDSSFNMALDKARGYRM